MLTGSRGGAILFLGIANFDILLFLSLGISALGEYFLFSSFSILFFCCTHQSFQLLNTTIDL